MPHVPHLPSRAVDLWHHVWHEPEHVEARISQSAAAARLSQSGAAPPPRLSLTKAAAAADGGRNYGRVLRENPQFARVFCGEIVSQIGNWFAYMSQVLLVQRFSGGSSSAIAGLIISRLLPATLLAPVLGAVADAGDKRRLMVGVLLLAGAASLLQCACVAPSTLPLLYLLLAVQAAAVALYDPLRRSLLPRLVPPAQLQEAATLDGLAWCVVLSVGAASGGFAVAAVGTTACLLLDAASFGLAAALCASLQPTPPDAAAGAAPKRAQGSLREVAGTLRGDPALGVYCLIKSCGASVWGTADIINVRCSTFPRMQSVGGPAVTLSLVYVGLGLGSLVGPPCADAVTPQLQRALLRSCAAAVGVCGGSFVLLAAAPAAGAAGLPLLVLGTAVRNLGSSVLWIYSTLLLQLRAPPATLGRLFSLEQALQTATAGAVAAAAGGAADAGAPLAGLAGYSMCAAAAEAAALFAYGALLHRPTDEAAGGKGGEEAEMGLLREGEREEARAVAEAPAGAGDAAPL